MNQPAAAQPPWLIIVAGLLDRFFWTFVAAFVGFYLTATTLGIDTAQAAALAGVVAVLTLGLALLTDWAIPDGLPWSIDALLRILRTYLIAVLTLVLANHDHGPVDLSFAGWKTALVGALPALFTALKVIAASRVGDRSSGALLPASLTTGA